MAGMGGNLMSELLGKDLQKSWSFSKYILRPRRHIGRLRFWLYDNGFSIINEQLVREGKVYLRILTVVPKEVAITRQMNADDIEYEFPLSLLRFRNPLTEDYLRQAAFGNRNFRLHAKGSPDHAEGRSDRNTEFIICKPCLGGVSHEN